MDIENAINQDFLKPDSRLRLALDLANRIIEHSSDSILISEIKSAGQPSPLVIFLNDTFKKKTGYSDEDLIGKTPRILQGPKTDLTTLARIRTSLEAWQPVREEVLNYKKNGEEFWQELNIFPVPNADGWFTHWVSIQRDITVRKTNELTVYELAYFDPLTGLPNRRLFVDRLQQTILKNARSNQHAAILYIDLDQFKMVNDRQGHAAGDLLLTAVAKRLGRCIRAGDTLSRIGGDEYIVLLDNLGNDFKAASYVTEGVSKRMLSAHDAPLQRLNFNWVGTLSIGITIFSGQQPHLIEELIKQADLAMYQAKALGRNRLQFYDHAMQAASREKNFQIENLRQALDGEWFVLYFQPQCDHLGNTLGFEALVRLQHPTHGLILPGAFIAVAESTRLIVQIGQWVLTQACKQLVRWAKQPQTAAYQLSVNISLIQLQEPDFVDLVEAKIKQTGANPVRLTLEITETLSRTHSEDIAQKIQRLKRCGIRLSLDDFGTGFSSLTYLKNLPFDELKIDQSFIADLMSNTTSASIVRATLNLSEALGLTVVAEGVETQEQLDFLFDAGCRIFQGYFFDKPMTIEALEVKRLAINALTSSIPPAA